MSQIDIEDIGGETPEPIAGLATRAWYARKSDFDTIVDTKKMQDDDPANVAANFEELMEINDDHVFNSGKCFKKIDFIQETGLIKTKLIGATGGKLFENDVTIELQGSSSKLLGFLRAIKNDKLIVLVEEVGTGHIRQLGFSKYGAIPDALDHEIAALVEGKNSATVTFKDKNFGPAPIYKGVISEAPAP